jgi:hypothetical protein
MNKLIWNTPEYKAIHQKLFWQRGRASDNQCTDCDDNAQDWSHRHDTDALDLINYDPRCKSCHRKYDYSKYGNHRAKLTDDQVREIRQKYSSGSTRKELSKEYGIAPSTAANVALGIKYKNVA